MVLWGRSDESPEGGGADVPGELHACGGDLLMDLIDLAPVDGDAGDTAVDGAAKACLSLVREQGDDIPMMVRREVATALLVDTPSPDPGGTTAPKVTGSKGNPAK
jgi:hypothetical protein